MNMKAEAFELLVSSTLSNQDGCSSISFLTLILKNTECILLVQKMQARLIKSAHVFIKLYPPTPELLTWHKYIAYSNLFLLIINLEHGNL